MTIDYKDTVFLPKTDFPMRGDLPVREPEILKSWSDQNLYAAMKQVRHGAPKWILHWGPPYANGRAHIGHAFTKSLKDIVVRVKHMQGFDAPLVPGWDCHGLPIEWKIEEQYREKNLNKDDVDILTFRQECREYAQKWADIQTEDFKRIAVNADWQNPYMTMHKRSEAIIAREIHKFLMNGLLYKGVKPVMWSVVEKTALAEAEVEYKEHKSITCHVAFPVVSSPVANLNGARVIIWTTTPWTLPSNRAIGFGNEVEYNIIKVTAIADGSKAKVGDVFIIASKLTNDLCTQAKITAHDVVETLNGSALTGTICAHPLRGQGYDFDVQLLAGDFVTDDTGTGFVHIAGGHGEDDFYLSVANGVEITDNVTDDGKFRDHVPLFAGLAVYTDKGELGDGNFAVLKSLDACGALIAKGSLRHEYPHSWRSKAPIIFRTTPQWFIAMDRAADGQTKTLRETSLYAIKDTKWFPAMGENRITSMVANRPDWCISRQRAWGVPIALFLDKNGNPLKDDTINKNIFEIFEREGSDAWYARPAHDFLAGTNYNADELTKVFDIVDVWFESGCTHAFVLKERDDLQWPADLYLEGSDQHRGWFQSSLLESCGTPDSNTKGRAPFKNVLTHGFVLDDKGYKMSKSLGNVIDPSDVMKEYGADILRLWAITSDYSEDVKIGKDTLKNASDLYRRFRNTLRYLLGALDGFDDKERVDLKDTQKLPSLEKAILSDIAWLKNRLKDSIERHDYKKFVNDLYEFCNSNLSSLYFDVRKDRLYCDRPDSHERRACRTTMAFIFEFLVTHLAPILPFTADEAWNFRPSSIGKGIDSVHLYEFMKIKEYKFDEIENMMKGTDELSAIRSEIFNYIEKSRKDGTITSQLEAKIAVTFDEKLKTFLEQFNWDELCVVSQSNITFAPNSSTPNNSVIHVDVTRAEGVKCERCWKILPISEMDKEFPHLSKRDADAVRYFIEQKQAA
jgi:isoleucyl-tRNA synthetase